MQWTRRALLKGGGAGLGLGCLGAGSAPLSVAAGQWSPLPTPSASPQQAASDESYWQKVAAIYQVTDTVTHLEHGNWLPMAGPVMEDYVEQTRRVNTSTSYYSRRQYPQDLMQVYQQLARALAVDADELAFTRGATEALQCLIGGYNRLRPGDAVLYADADYDAMQTAMAWLRVRRGVEAIKIALPEGGATHELVEAYEQVMRKHRNIRLVLLTHVSHRHGGILPVARIAAVARSYDADVILDAAHSWGQLDFSLDELGVDFIGFNLHKWIGAPLGVGAMYIKRQRIADIDPFMGEPQGKYPIHARVHTGTTNMAAYLAVPTALKLHASIGARYKQERLSYLRDRWMRPLKDHSRIRLLNSLSPEAQSGIAAFRLGGQTSMEENVAVSTRLLERFKIFSVAREGLAAGACVRITPSFFTRADEMDRLSRALSTLADS